MTPASHPLVSFERVTFGHRRGQSVVRDVSWGVSAGRTVLLGPNGAGKSTLLRLAVGMLRPTSGRIAGVGGSRIGYLPQHVRAVAGLTCHEQVAYAGWLKGLSRGEAAAGATDALGQVGLGPLARRAGQSLSGGELRRLGLAQALVGQPRMLLLDEPHAALDPAQRESLTDLLISLDVPMLITTHQTEGLAELCSRVAVMDRGRVIADVEVERFLDHDPTGRRDPVLAYKNVLSGPGGGADQCD